MSQKLVGDIKKLSASSTKSLLKLFNRKLDYSELVPLDLARELYALAVMLNRKLGLLVNRDGVVEEVIVGSREILYLPDLGRYRVGRGRLRRLRLLITDISSKSSKATITQDIYTDLEKLRLDAVCAIKQNANKVSLAYAYNLPYQGVDFPTVQTEEVSDLSSFDKNFGEFLDELEEQHAGLERTISLKPNGALLVGVYNISEKQADASIVELKELARTAGVNVLGVVVQRKEPDARTFVGKGKLEQLVLESLRLGAEMIIFDTELKPAQWRAVTNATEMKVLDRSMLILDIFAQRATSSDGRLQVELAQLKYNLPRLVEKDAGLSRLTGGIGGRGPGETKLEIGRRRIRDRIARLEKMIDDLGTQRSLRRKKRQDNKVPLVAILGYTNAGKSTLFNALTTSRVLSEDKLFATLDPTQSRLGVPVDLQHSVSGYKEIILTDTVGFIRDLPHELLNAFRATLEELSQADLLLHVMSAEDDDLQSKHASVMKTLQELELLDIPRIDVLNKIDLLSSDEIIAKQNEYSAIAVSALKRVGFQELKALIGARISTQQESVGAPTFV